MIYILRGCFLFIYIILITVYRLLSYVEHAVGNSPISAWTNDVTANCSNAEPKEAMKLLSEAFEVCKQSPHTCCNVVMFIQGVLIERVCSVLLCSHRVCEFALCSHRVCLIERVCPVFSQGVFDRESLLRCVLAWKAKLESCKITGRGDPWTPELGAWLSAARLDGVTLSPPVDPTESDKQRLAVLLKDIGMASISPSDVLAVCEAGSRLYNLALPTSDTDYIVIYRHPTQQLISSCRSLKVGRPNILMYYLTVV